MERFLWGEKNAAKNVFYGERITSLRMWTQAESSLASHSGWQRILNTDMKSYVYSGDGFNYTRVDYSNICTLL